jgi:hypothetical protein
MPRSNRPRRRGPEDEPAPLDLERARAGTFRVEVKRDGAWNVQPQAAVSAVKVYTCPGCGQEIAEGTAHLVAWRADGVLGDAADLASRRHWHARCWAIRT